MSAREGQAADRAPRDPPDGSGSRDGSGRLSVERLFELSRDLLCIAGIDGRFRRVNPAFVKTLGWTEEELLERPFLEFVHPGDQAATEAEVAKLAQGIPTISFENRYRHAEGGWVHLHWTSQPDPAAGLVYAIARDVGPQKRAEAELRAAKETAERADRMKSQFLASLSHEIRTPMNGILGMTELALERSRSPEVRDQLEAVRESAEALLHLLDDLLDLARIESGNLRLEVAPFRLQRLIDGVIRPFSTQLGHRPIELRSKLEPGLPEVWVGDAGRLRQVLVNLVGNALKFTARGEVRVEARAAEHAGRPSLELAVTDTGPGIRADRLETIFERYTQFHAREWDAPRGAGLGLAISTQLTHAMGGELQVESQEGRGSTFRLRIPLQPGDERDLAETDPGERRVDRAQADLPPLRILVAEDSPTNQAVARGFLERRGHRVTVVDTGVRAVEAVAAGDFDLVLMDLEMPELDGLAATRAIRAAEGDAGRRVPILALTAHALAGHRSDCLTAGMDGFVTKPLRERQLFGAIARAIAATAGRAGAGAPTTSAPPRGLVDWEAALRVVGGHQTILTKVVQAGIEELPELLERLESAIDAGETESVQRLAHTLKGALLPFGVSQQVSEAERLEDAARRGAHSDTAHRFAELEPAVRRLVAELAQVADREES
ncbi:MAG TPA: ATP-binding protein [Thermoanaerobaculia bacterium]|nr:ATP-binding protein [Thermoanaerobaculia bacterium]